MRLDRNQGGRETGKYALIKMREIARIGGVEHGNNPDIAAALKILELNDLIEYGSVGGSTEFFVIKLRDQFAEPALRAYAHAAVAADHEYATDVHELAGRAGIHSPFCKRPD